jgi:hypothetical protein
VVRDKVIFGISGCTTPDTGGGCFVIAHGTARGKEVWRSYVIARPDDPADATWSGMCARHRGTLYSAALRITDTA